ncbi:MAG: HAMP domain-containing histidine kinase [Rhodospirillales bacterium]|nr:HAMP domain-containing histidine kinase [Rhodospirillales bacterium]
MNQQIPQSPSAFTGLSIRLLLLTIFFIMIAEALIWTPSVSRFRKVYMEERIVWAHLATLALEALPDGTVDRGLGDKLLFHAEAYGIVLHRPEQRVLMVSKSMPPKVDLTINVDQNSAFGWIRDSFDTLLQNRNRVLRVIGTSQKDPTVMVEIVMDETPMREAMYEFSARILNLSVVISLFAATLVYLTLNWLLIRPMRRITASIREFRRSPEDALREIKPSGRRDEIGITERELARMQDEVRQALAQQSRLATLGAGMAKINHDLRNSLATAVLAFDKLALVDDPEVKRTLPRLYNSIDKAVKLCSQTLNYVGKGVPQMNVSRFHLFDLVDEVGVQLSEPAEEHFEIHAKADIVWKNEIDPDLEILGDREQLFRAFANMGRNAYEAGASQITFTAELRNELIEIRVSDDGPGLAEKAKDRLFQPFVGSVKEGGTGLGLVIVRDILKAHGGDIVHLETDSGTTFKITLMAERK